VALLKTRPWLLLLAPIWFLRGRAYGKRRLAQSVQLDPSCLPYRNEVLEFIRGQRALGREIVLATAADEMLAHAVARYLGIFDAVYASDGITNLKGSAKALLLRSIFGDGRYAYLGDSSSDLAVWKTAATALVVSSSKSLANRAAALAPIEKQFTVERGGWRSLLRSIRIHHWAKNSLIFLPMALAHRITPLQLVRGLAAFVLFGMAASSMYLLNDLLDLKSDRQHPWKRRRPFASGSLSIPTGLGSFFVLLSASLLLGLKWLGAGFVGITAAYCLAVVIYSVRIKREPLLDVFVLSSFYVFRILLGGIVTSVPLSTWFLVCSGFFFFSMALAKRYSELIHAKDLVASGNSGRGYLAGDREVIAILGIGSALCSVVIFCLYVQSRDVLVLYMHPGRLLLLAPIVLYWMSRTWLRAHRGELQDDPLTLALTDRVSYLLAAIALVIVLSTAIRH